MNLPSKLIEDAVNAFASLPGIGKKTALRLTLHLLNAEEQDVVQFGEAVIRMRKEIKFCLKCHNISEKEICTICASHSRNQELICVVEDLRDLIAIENTNQYNGTFHILSGIISPVDGIGPEDINIETLVKRIEEDGVKEIVMALSPTIEGDTTIFYISKRLKNLPVKITTIARGIAFGGDLEYVDELTLSRSLANRLPYENYLINRQ